jgi:dinuclear metal center YbgI/SA1388 family protein
MKNHFTAHMLADELNAYIGGQHIADRGPNGLQITNYGTIAKIATAVSTDLATIEQAVALNVQALITHHALLNIFPIVDVIEYKKIALLMQHNIALLRYHLPLDAHHIIGNNWYAARELGWQDLQPFGLYSNVPIGVQGTIAPTPFASFVEQLERYYANKATTVKLHDTIRSVAVVSGKGYTFIDQAAQANVDCLVTGSVDEPAWYDAHAYGISLCALGHAATEKIGPRALATYINQTYGIETVFIDTANPF